MIQSPDACLASRKGISRDQSVGQAQLGDDLDQGAQDRPAQGDDEPAKKDPVENERQRAKTLSRASSRTRFDGRGRNQPERSGMSPG
jgi:hypothetical protein